MFRGGNLEIVERRWILIAGECKAGNGMGYIGSYLLAFDQIDRIGIVFSFFLRILLARNFNFESHRRNFSILGIWMNLLIYIYLTRHRDLLFLSNIL